MVNYLSYIYLFNTNKMVNTERNNRTNKRTRPAVLDHNFMFNNGIVFKYKYYVYI